MKVNFFLGLTALLVLVVPAQAWDYEGHHAVNELALATLPPNFGGFELTPAQKIRTAYLAGEPDRWRNVYDLELRNGSAPDHFFDLEDLPLYGLTPETLPPLRYDFVADLTRARTAHPEKFAAVDPAKDADHTRELGGFLPWTITEYYEKLKSDFAVLNTFKHYGGTPDEIANAQADIVYTMGVMGHFVGDGAQSLHTTVHFNGWVGPNPQGYTTWASIHSWIDGGYFRKTGGIKTGPLLAEMQPAARLPGAADAGGVFKQVVAYLVADNQQVVPLYELEKTGGFSGNGPRGQAGRPFLDGQLVKGAQMLGNLWYTAWLEAPDDTYLRRQLQLRAQAADQP